MEAYSRYCRPDAHATIGNSRKEATGACALCRKRSRFGSAGLSFALPEGRRLQTATSGRSADLPQVASGYGVRPAPALVGQVLLGARAAPTAIVKRRLSVASAATESHAKPLQ